MYGKIDNELREQGEFPIEHNDWVKVRQSSVHLYMYLGIDLDDPLIAFNNWEKNND